MFSIGIFENPTDEMFPTHVSPILMGLTDRGYVRYYYKIGRNGSPIVLGEIGISRYKINDLFPHKSYFFHELRIFQPNYHTILLSKNDVIYTDRLIVLLFGIVRNFRFRFFYIRNSFFTISYFLSCVRRKIACDPDL